MSERGEPAEETSVQGAVARKAAIGRARRPEPVAMTPERALALALGRVADKQMALPMRVLQSSPRSLSLAEIPETIMEQPLIAMMEGPGENLGMIAICPTLVASLIEIQTVGRLSHRPVTARRPTRTDAAMAAVFLDSVMEAFEQLLADAPGQGWVAGYRYASYLDEPRPLGLMMEDCAYRGFALELALGGDGQRQGRMVLALPATVQSDSDADLLSDNPARRAAAAQAASEAQDWARQLEEGVMSAELTLTGVLDRMRLPLSEVLGWATGALVPLQENAIAEIGIEVAGMPGRPVMRARLGQNHGSRALRLLGANDGASLGAEQAAFAVAAVPAQAAPMSAAPEANDPEVSLGPAPVVALGEAEPSGGPDSGLAPLPMSLAIGGDEDEPSSEADSQVDELEPLPMKISAFG